MTSKSRLRLAAACLAISLPAFNGLAQTAGRSPPNLKPPPVEAFFQPARLQDAALSPSGRWLAAQVVRPGERAVLVVSDLDDKEPAKVVAAFSKHDVQGVRWVNDDLLVFEVDDNLDRSREAIYKGAGLMSVQRDGEQLRLLIKREWKNGMFFAAQGTAPLEANHDLLAIGKAGSDELIVGERMYDNNRDFSALRPIKLDARTGQRSSLLDNAPADVKAWWFDHQGTPRAAMASKNGQYTLYWQDLVDKRWREIARFPWLDAPYWPAFVDGGGQLYVTQTDDGTGVSGIRLLDTATGRLAAQPMVSVPGFDSNFGAVIDRDTGQLLGLNLLTDGRTQVWLATAMKALQVKVDAALPGRINLLSCRPCDKPRRLLVRSYSDRQPGEYLLYDVGADRWQRLGVQRPAIDPGQMGRMDFHRIKARDGAELPLWVTLPPGGAAQPKPAVVLVHGGPWTRGAEWAWDAESQYLATRGYVVIQPEFRGSTGYGRAHYRAGWQQWGQAMQDDVTDALRFAVQKGWVDPQRVCIVGASYGGYATLMGLAKDPDQYRCGVAWVGVTDPRLMFSIHWSDIGRESKQHTMPQMIGDPVKDAERLKANAPVELAAKIKAPVMLVYGALDMRVPIEHGERMREVLRQAGNPPEWHVYGDEGHGWRRPENILDFWRRVDTFLSRHLKP
ncbi:MAG: hypothetical protein A3E25_18360 [Burkholderiales bacterium RIFCSPHIGHO2_12_FULL_69_20]|nr:MAG: hypothetical protein A3E25_18360 [Burkholderiales bacterium RIFCSPHIGHO2_12_FULL_69_20]